MGILSCRRTTSHPAKDEGDGTADEDKPLGLVLRKCIMCLLPFDELGSIETESPEELKRIVDNVYKIAKIEVSLQLFAIVNLRRF